MIPNEAENLILTGYQKTVGSLAQEKAAPSNFNVNLLYAIILPLKW
ncbi:MAG TPA: hypothetical protein VFX64_02045 [Candidatus Nitrosotalea sp.]|nr:hypothetical protein [Candidatus Nitrosotalea sp.]